MKFTIGTATLALCAAAAMAPAHATIVGTADSSNSIPFGGPGGSYYYQQVYSAASFSSAFDINDLTFYNSVSPGGTPATGSFNLFLSTTSAAIPTFDTSAFAFPDASFTEVFVGSLPSLSGGKLALNLSSAFHYDPSAGNLVLTVRNFDLPSGYTLYLDTDQNVGVTNSRFSAYSYDWNQGLVTGFNESAASVPLPAGLPLMLSGLGALGGMWRRRRTRAMSV